MSRASAAALYDAFCPWDERGDFGFYLQLPIGPPRGFPSPEGYSSLSGTGWVP